MAHTNYIEYKGEHAIKAPINHVERQKEAGRRMLHEAYFLQISTGIRILLETLLTMYGKLDILPPGH